MLHLGHAPLAEGTAEWLRIDAPLRQSGGLFAQEDRGLRETTFTPG